MAAPSVYRRSLLRRVASIGLLTWTVASVADAERPAVAIAGGLMATTGLLSRPRYPILVLAGALVGMVTAGLVGGFPGPDDPFIAALIWAAYGAGRYGSLRRQPWAAAATLFFLSLNLSTQDLGFPSVVVFPVFFSAFPWLMGLWVQRLEQRSDAALQLVEDVTSARQQEVHRATAEERLRIARELHDVAAHHMTTVSLQSQVLRERLASGKTLHDEDLVLMSRSAQEALGEIRRVVGVLRGPGDRPDVAPLPTVGDLPALIGSSREAGQQVDFAVEGAPRLLADGVSLTLYRIAQEALSNARRHGRSPSTTVTLTWRRDEVRLRAVNTISTPRRRTGHGNGLVGMRERVELYGGYLRAGPDDAGNWTVDVTLPVKR